MTDAGSQLDELIAESRGIIQRLRGELEAEERILQRLLARRDSPADRRTFTVRARPGGFRPRGTVVVGSMVSQIIRAMKELGRPARAGEIAKVLASKGITSDTKGGLAIAVSSQLAHGRKRHFDRVGPGTYVLKGAPKAAPSEGGGP